MEANKKSLSRSSSIVSTIRSLKDSSPPASAIGVTRFIAQVLRRGRLFRVPGKRPAGKTKITGEKGLQIGRYTDLLYQRICAGKAKLDLDNPKHARCRNIFRILKKHNMIPIMTQKTVSLGPEFALKTQVDGIALHGQGVAVLEIKTTQYTMEQHKARYNTPSIGARRLANKAENTEAVAHQLQLAFGVLGLRRLLSTTMPDVRVGGLVIVLCSDGGLSYPLNAIYNSTGWFDLGRSSSASSLPPQHTALQSFLVSLPSGSDRKRIDDLLKSHRRGTITAESGYGSFVASNNRSAATVCCLLHNPDFKLSSRRFRGSRDRALEDAKRLEATKKFKSCRAAVIQFHEGRWKFSPVRSGKKASTALAKED